MARYEEKICKVRGEVCVDTPNDVGNDYEPGTIELCEDIFEICFFRVRKTEGAATKVCQSINDFFIIMYSHVIGNYTIVTFVMQKPKLNSFIIQYFTGLINLKVDSL